ncbi:MAG: hypothetical protein GY842_01430 [bacterium]|nr:hypothetical protein [bacterium]
MRALGRMIRWRTLACTTLVLGGPCLPDNIFGDLFGSSISAITGVLLSDLLNVVLPPV